MIDPRHVPDVTPDETLVRFILFSNHIRPSDDTIKPDAFIPHPRNELSVTRHRDATEDEVWGVGMAVAEALQRTLHGRGDVLASAFLEQGLVVTPDPIINHPVNPNHANVTGWPKDDKGQQRLLALEVAARAKLVRYSA
ncbi:MAG: hypothetical protein ABIG44_05025 [Planctomycetota bacterium]